MKKKNITYIGIISSCLLIGYLIGVTNNNNASVHQHIGESDIEHTCSMHPDIRQSGPGQCPICGMDLTPVEVDSNDDNPLEIKMSTTALQLADVQTSIVTATNQSKQVRLDGKIQVDERAVFSQTSHISGRIEKLLVGYTGEYIRKGQIIAYVYSPELVTAQEELFVAYKIRQSQPSLFSAAKDKLKNWKLTNEQIEGIIKSGKPNEHFPILSDLSGVVTSKKVKLGDHIHQGATLFDVADLSSIWVLFDIYESDISWVKLGNEIEYTVQSFPGEVFEGMISFIDPVIDPTTRVAKARVVSTNRNMMLKPEMFVSGVLNSSSTSKEEKVITIPKSAVLWTGKRSVVYVKAQKPETTSFTYRSVTLGTDLGNSYVITDGLEEGEEIVTHGAFSIDAAAQLAGKPSMMNPHGNGKTTKHNHQH